MKTLYPAISFLSRDMSLKTMKKIEVEDILKLGQLAMITLLGIRIL